MTLEFRSGDFVVRAVPFDQFDEFAAFDKFWASRVVPGARVLNSWDHTAQSWARPAGVRRLRIPPGVQCFCLSRFGERDPADEKAMLTRLLSGLKGGMPTLRSAIDRTLPSSVFACDVDLALSGQEKRSKSWEILGQAQFDHFVLQFPHGRIGDWALMSVATDFTISRRALDPSQAKSADASRGDGSLAERVFDMMSAPDWPGATDRKH